MIQGGFLAYLLIRLSGADREVMEKWLHVSVPDVRWCAAVALADASPDRRTRVREQVAVLSNPAVMLPTPNCYAPDANQRGHLAYRPHVRKHTVIKDQKSRCTRQ